MNVNYRDIIDRAGPPDWWGPGGVPRYGPFDPAVIDIYANQAALYEIECQACRRRFQVGEAWSISAAVMRVRSIDFKAVEASAIRARLEAGEGLHYGDPPNVGCCPSGPTMSSFFVRVLEYHEREFGGDWRRVPEVEAHELPDETDDDGSRPTGTTGPYRARYRCPECDDTGEVSGGRAVNLRAGRLLCAVCGADSGRCVYVRPDVAADLTPEVEALVQTDEGGA